MMEPEPPADRLRQLFLAALERPPDDREPFLAGACDDASERGRVARLLDRHLRDGPLDHPPTIDAALDPGTYPADADLPAGTLIDDFEILELIGRGGMGAVYRATQVGPLRRTVALKIVRPGLAGPEMTARFEAEDADALQAIIAEFSAQLSLVDPALELDY